MTDLAKRLVIGIVLFFLVAFTYTQMVKASKAQAEADRLAVVNAELDSIATHWLDSLSVIDTLLRTQLATNDSLAQRTGPIRWRTRWRTVIEPGRVDTLMVLDSVPIVDIDSVPFVIPVEVAQELQECRVLVETCDQFKQTADSTIKWQATHIDSLSAQIKILDKRFKVPGFDMFGFTLPLPSIDVGYGLMYSMRPCDNTVSISPSEFDAEISVDCDRLHHGPTIGLSWQIWSP